MCVWTGEFSSPFPLRLPTHLPLVYLAAIDAPALTPPPIVCTRVTTLQVCADVPFVLAPLHHLVEPIPAAPPIHVPTLPGYDVDVDVRNRLAGRFAILDRDVECRRMVEAAQGRSQAAHRGEEVGRLGRCELAEARRRGCLVRRWTRNEKLLRFRFRFRLLRVIILVLVAVVQRADQDVTG